MQEEVMQRGEEIYQEQQEELKQRYGEEVVAIDTETGDIVGHGETLSDATEDVETSTPGSIYFKRVGEEHAARLM